MSTKSNAMSSMFNAIGTAMDNAAARMEINHNIKMMESIVKLEKHSVKLINDTAIHNATVEQEVTEWKSSQTEEIKALFNTEKAHLTKLFQPYTSRPQAE